MTIRHAVDNGSRNSSATDQSGKRSILLDDDVADAIARLAKTLGYVGSNATPSFIESCIRGRNWPALEEYMPPQKYDPINDFHECLRRTTLSERREIANHINRQQAAKAAERYEDRREAKRDTVRKLIQRGLISSAQRAEARSLVDRLLI